MDNIVGDWERRDKVDADAGAVATDACVGDCARSDCVDAGDARSCADKGDCARSDCDGDCARSDCVDAGDASSCADELAVANASAGSSIRTLDGVRDTGVCRKQKERKEKDVNEKK